MFHKSLYSYTDFKSLHGQCQRNDYIARSKTVDVALLMLSPIAKSTPVQTWEKIFFSEL